jgi:cysteine synthase A
MQLQLLADEGNLVRMAIDGALDSLNAAADADALVHLLDRRTLGRTVLMDLARVTMINSQGVSWLLNCHKRLDEGGGRLIFHSVPPLIMEVLQFLRVGKVLTLASDEAAARDVAAKAIPQASDGAGSLAAKTITLPAGEAARGLAATARPPIADGILATVTNTPLVRLRHLYGDAPFTAYGKIEGVNPGGSVKDRPALAMIERALATGELRRDGVVVESSSGNLAIGLAQTCAYHRLRLVCVIDPRTNPQTVQILRAYGAEVDLVTQPDTETGEFLPVRLRRVLEHLMSIPNSFWPNQYTNPESVASHQRTTMREIAAAFDDGGPDFLFCPTSTCGTIGGCVEYIREKSLRTKVVAVDALGSQIFGSIPCKRHVPGLGAPGVPPLFPHGGLIHHHILVGDRECVVGCRRLVRREAIFAGGSAGGVVMAVERMRDDIPPGSSCVLIFPDRGDRYLDTLYSESWVRENLGEIPETDADPKEGRPSPEPSS